MKYSLALAALATTVLGFPAEKRQDSNIDVVVLQFALTLEHLENVFYKGALQKFSQADFAAAGYGANYYNTLKYIASDEETHTKFLTTALTAAKQQPVAACEYSFPYTDVNSFITLSTLLEGVGTSAYLGGAPLITDKGYLTAAGSILVSEALHTSLQRGAIKALPNANPFWAPLDPTSVFTLAAAFIKKCPDSNYKLPFTPFPSLAVDNQGGFCEQVDCSPYKLQKREADAHWNDWKPTTTTTAKYPAKTTSAPTNPKPSQVASAPLAGAPITFTAQDNIPAGSFVTFISGLTITSVTGQISGKKVTANIPAGVSGQSYVLITKSKVEGTLSDDQVLFGPAILEVKPAPPSIDFNYRKE